MRIRYRGSDESRDLAVPGGLIACPRNQWVDITKTAAETGIAEGHAEIVALALAPPDWEVDDGTKKTEPKGDDK